MVALRGAASMGVTLAVLLTLSTESRRFEAVFRVEKFGLSVVNVCHRLLAQVQLGRSRIDSNAGDQYEQLNNSACRRRGSASGNMVKR